MCRPLFMSSARNKTTDSLLISLLLTTKTLTKLAAVMYCLNDKILLMQ